ncbi:PREDICTED: polygalacturonase [Prunus dulcis]|uniref:PREDICTED: polygalacturonase n=1 Tax=Prunus dulcis TaxID=3755 RepID=A0A5E4G7L1_PRUDU|nr:PREDICTED: polygalacturonase [Prunus dulcis]
MQIYNVLSFGAVGNGVKDDTQAFKNTWNAACQAQIRPYKSRLVFQIDGTLMPPDGPKQWPPNTNKQDRLLFKGVHGMLMQGNGLINGRGEKWWDLPCKPHKGGRSPSVSDHLGSLGKGNSKACVTNITVSDSTIKNSDNGVRIKTWQGGSGSVSEVTFKDIHMDIVLNPIIIDQFYCLSKKCPNQTSALMINSVHFSNIKGTYDSRKPPMHLACSDSMPCKNLTLLGIDLVPAQGGAYLDPFCWKAFGPKDTFSTRQVPCLMKGYPKMLQHDVDRTCF